MTKFIVPTLSLLFVATPVLADKQAPVTFSRDGETYQYVVTEKSGVKHIDGVMVSSGQSFSLVVAQGQVTGEYDGRPVSFKTKEALKPEAVASR